MDAISFKRTLPIVNQTIRSKISQIKQKREEIKEKAKQLRDEKDIPTIDSIEMKLK